MGSSLTVRESYGTEPLAGASGHLQISNALLEAGEGERALAEIQESITMNNPLARE